jgi:hypothetical protein
VDVFDSTLKTLERAIEFPSTICPLSVATDGHERLYVAGYYFSAGSTQLVDVFAPNASGAASPLRSIGGPDTQIFAVTSLAVDASGLLYVTNSEYGYPEFSNVVVFGPRADGNKKPLRELQGSQTGLVEPLEIALGADGNMYIANRVSTGIYDILVFPRSAKGNVAPLWTLQSGIYGQAIALGAGGEMYLAPGAQAENGGIAIYAAGASGNATPIGFVGPEFKYSKEDPVQMVLEHPWYEP